MEGGGWRVKKKLLGRKILSVMKLEGENWSVEGGGWSVERSLTRKFLAGKISKRFGPQKFLITKMVDFRDALRCCTKFPTLVLQEN